MLFVYFNVTCSYLCGLLITPVCCVLFGVCVIFASLVMILLIWVCGWLICLLLFVVLFVYYCVDGGIAFVCRFVWFWFLVGSLGFIWLFGMVLLFWVVVLLLLLSFNFYLFVLYIMLCLFVVLGLVATRYKFGVRFVRYFCFVCLCWIWC